jgi:UTP--glucose-1-phosphate uridylyltransferase
MGFQNEPNVTQQLVESFEQSQASTVSVMKVADKDVSKYGIAEMAQGDPKESVASQSYFKVQSFIEKPKASETKSRWALPGRYVFTNEIMSLLKNAKPTLNGEIQLTDSMRILAQKEDCFAMTFTAQRYDTGDKLGFLQANIEMGLNHPMLKEELQQYILALAMKLKGK